MADSDNTRRTDIALVDHPLRYTLANELHARPFPPLSAPCGAAYLAVKRPEDAAARDRGADLAHLTALLDRHGADHPRPGATHWYGQIGRHHLKWESHTEFVTYTVFIDGVEGRPFDPRAFDVFPTDWLAKAPGQRIASALIRVEALDQDAPDPEIAIRPKLSEWFVTESMAVSRVLDDAMVIAGDFRIDPAGHMRFAAFARSDTGTRRIGRVVQRLCEIETYKTMSMLGLSRVRGMGDEMGRIDRELSVVMDGMSRGDAEAALDQLLRLSSRLETMLAQSSFRFGATSAYEVLVRERIAVMREAPFDGLQTFAEFMNRRFEPAMRTVAAGERRLQAMAERAIRAANLLRTRVDVERSGQNQALLASMDRRADMQLRLQHTVEGLSVVAISYYAVGLAIYLLGPLAEIAAVSKGLLAAVVTPVVILGVWWSLRRIRRSLH